MNTLIQLLYHLIGLGFKSVLQWRRTLTTIILSVIPPLLLIIPMMFQIQQLKESWELPDHKLEYDAPLQLPKCVKGNNKDICRALTYFPDTPHMREIIDEFIILNGITDMKVGPFDSKDDSIQISPLGDDYVNWRYLSDRTADFLIRNDNVTQAIFSLDPYDGYDLYVNNDLEIDCPKGYKKKACVLGQGHVFPNMTRALLRVKERNGDITGINDADFDTKIPTITVNEMDELVKSESLSSMFAPLFLVMLVSPLLIPAMTSIVEDRVSKTKEFLMLLGIDRATYQISKTIAAFGTAVISGLVLTFGSKVLNFYIFDPSTPTSILFAIFTFSSFLFVGFGYTFSGKPKTTKSASVYGSVIFVLNLVISVFINITFFMPDLYKSFTTVLNMALSIVFPQYAVQGLFTSISDLVTQKKVPVTWSLLWEAPKISETKTGVAPIKFFYIMVGVGIFYNLWTPFIATVKGYDGCTKQGYLFLFKPSFWAKKQTKIQKGSSIIAQNQNPYINDEIQKTVNMANKSFFKCIRLTKVYESEDASLKSSSSGAKTALSSVTFSLDQGQILYIAGPSGCGKSTLFNIITGISSITSGDILINGVSTSGRPSRSVAYVPQYDLTFKGLNPLQHLKVVSVLSGVFPNTEKLKNILSSVDLSGSEITRPVHKLSGGMRRRLCFSCTLARIQAIQHANPMEKALVVADEALTGVDVYTRELLIQRFREMRSNGHSIIMSSHELSEGDELADKIIFISGGTIMAVGTHGEILDQYPSYQRLTVVPRSTSIEGIEAIVQKYLPVSLRDQIRLKFTESGQCLFVLTGLTAIQVTELIHKLENDAEFNQLVLAIGISEASLESIYVQLTEQDAVDDGEERRKKKKKREEEKEKKKRSSANNDEQKKLIEVKEYSESVDDEVSSDSSEDSDEALEMNTRGILLVNAIDESSIAHINVIPKYLTIAEFITHLKSFNLFEGDVIDHMDFGISQERYSETKLSKIVDEAMIRVQLK